MILALMSYCLRVVAKDEVYAAAQPIPGNSGNTVASVKTK